MRATTRGALALVVEDALPVRAVVVEALRRDGFLVNEAASGEEARSQLAKEPPDVIVLDLVLPDVSGFELLREIVAAGTAPVVVLSGRGDELDRLLGLELGAEDYVVKPFYPRELVARVRRASQRGVHLNHSPSDTAGLVVDRKSRQVWVRGRPVITSKREFDLLAHLASSPRQVFSREALLRDVWGSSSTMQSPKTVTEHIRRLRQKVEDDPTRPRWIVTVGSAGYRLDPEGDG